MITLQQDQVRCQKKRMEQTDIADWPLFLLELAVSVLCLGGSCCSPISFTPSLLLPAEVKMSHWVSSWSPSSPISPRIPQETSCRIVTLWQHHFPFTLLWTCLLPGKKACNDKNLWWLDFCSCQLICNLHVSLMAFCLNKPCVFNLGRLNAAKSFLLPPFKSLLWRCTVHHKDQSHISLRGHLL